MPKVTLLPGGQSAEVPAGTLLLDAGEAAGVEMEAGCFNCSCGTCAVEIASGMENLDPPTDEELNVLDQWNKDPEKYRLTCCVKIQKGEVVIRLGALNRTCLDHKPQRRPRGKGPLAHKPEACYNPSRVVEPSRRATPPEKISKEK